MSFLNQATLDQVNASYEYIAIFGIILLESAGIPLPGETILIGAAVYAGSHQTLDTQSPKNGNISNIRRRLSAISLPQRPIWEPGDR